MNKDLNLGNKKSTIETLQSIKDKAVVPIDIRIRNGHISDLNIVLGRKVFKKDALYISSETIWEIMQPLGKKGRHNYHNLSPEDIYNALSLLRYSTDVSISYDDRYLIVTLATVFEDVNIAVIVTPSGTLKSDLKTKVNRIITIYPLKIKK